jgi:transglutaminase-like putative cysteine protease
MQISIGYDIGYGADVPTPMVTMLNVHPSRHADLVGFEQVTTEPYAPISYYRDGFGNVCGRLVVPPGGVVLSCRAIVRDSGMPDVVVPNATQLPIEQLPDECLVYLMGSRYCETDKLTDLAWSLFKDTPPGWARVQAICDYVHNHLTFGYQFAAPTKSAHSVHDERRGVCRDFAHLAVTPAISATSACRRKTRRWISPPGSRSICREAGTPSMRATISRASAASWSGAVGMPPTCR